MEKIKKGYKQTELGIIPEDWNVLEIKDIANIISGGTPSTSNKEYWDGDILWCTPADITKNKSKYIINTNRKITFKGLNRSSATLLPIGALLLCSRATIGDVCISLAVVATNQGFKSLICKNNVSNEYVYYQIPYLKKQMLKKAFGSTFLEISKANMQSILISIPPTEIEQSMIATVLSDIDSLIEAFDKNISKKQLIKQGARQELLTPKPHWNSFLVREIAEVSRGRVISHNEINKSYNNYYPVFSSQTSNNGIMGYIDTYDFDGEYVTWTTDGENAGKVFYRNEKFNCTNVCGTLKILGNHAKFVAFLLDTLTDRYVSKNLANPKLMNDVMKNIRIKLPELLEQVSTANILSDMDNEIEELKNKRNKYISLKQGAMQKLLTGQIRLSNVENNYQECNK